MTPWLKEHLACPRHRLELTLEGDHLICPDRDRYLVVDGVPVLLFDDGRPAHGHIKRTLEQVSRIENGESVSAVIPQYLANDYGVDEFVQQQLHLTCGNLYFAVQKNLARYPFPDLRLPTGNGRRLLDIGCSWGRWTIPAAKRGFRAVGIDPHLDGVLAAKRIAAQNGVDADFVVGDAVYLPFLDDTFEMVFSSGVLQHLAKSTVTRILADISRVARDQGKILIQMPNTYGLRSLYMQAKRSFKTPSETNADVSYWTPNELRRKFNFHFGRTTFTADCFFGLNLRSSDVDLMPLSHKMAIYASEIARKACDVLPPVRNFADSLLVESINEKDSLDKRN
ncbi:hypothetical protein BH20ACI2_BH20ACI2_05130 [soil metagenome]